MEISIQELRSSWTHCKELITSSASLDLVVAFLEDFKIQFTEFHKRIKYALTQKHKHITYALVDKAYIFWNRKGELSQLISFVKKNWNAKKRIVKHIQLFDSIISTIITTYTPKKLHTSNI